MDVAKIREARKSRMNPAEQYYCVTSVIDSLPPKPFETKLKPLKPQTAPVFLSIGNSFKKCFLLMVCATISHIATVY